MNLLKQKPLFNPEGETDISKRRMIMGDTTNLNDFNNLRYDWTSEWYRQAMNNFWIPEEVNLNTDLKDYSKLNPAQRRAYDKILSFLIFLDSIQTANLPNIGDYITANEVNLCLAIQTYQESIHSQSYSYMLDTIAQPHERDDILYQWKNDQYLLLRNTFIGEQYNAFANEKSGNNFMRAVVANYILEGIYFYSGFMFFYNLGRSNLMPGTVQIIRYINRDENTHLWLFRNMLLELKKENPEYFTPQHTETYRYMVKEGCEQEIAWGHYAIGDDVQGLTKQMITDYVQYLGNLRCTDLGFEPIYPGHSEEPENLAWVSNYSDPNMIKTDFFEARSTAYSKSGALEDDL